MNSNIILELREKDGTEIANGNYEVNLSVPITINDGDTILMKQFKSMRQSTGKVTIKKAIQLFL